MKPLMPHLRTLLPLLLVPVVACDSVPAGEAADLVLTDGRVVTVDAALPEAEAVAMRDGRIVAVGSSREIEAYVGDATEVIDLEGRLAIPGFIEGHGHYLSLGRSKEILDLMEVTSWEEIVSMVEAAVASAEPGEWIEGRGWHQEKWSSVPEGSVEGVPVHDALSAVSPENPVRLGHASGHASFVNAAVLEAAGIDAATADPPGGEIVKDAAGNPTGLLRETAQGLINRARSADVEPPPTAAERDAAFRRRVRLAGEDALTHGVTAFHDAGSDFATIDRFRELADAGELPVRLYVMVRNESLESMREGLDDYFMEGYADGFLTVRSIKEQIDGALGPHGAWLLEPYEDLPSSTGLNLEEPEVLADVARVAVEHGYQLNIHAIGDRANRETLDIYEEVWDEMGVDGSELRWRIEHAQHIHPDDLPRFAELGVVASMQGIHGTSDGPWVLKRLGEERAESGAYMWRTLTDMGVVINNGTDVPVERISPIASFHATVSRMTVDGPFYPGEALTREEALATYTINNAYAAFAEDELGSITVGKYADIAVLDRDILSIPIEEIPEARVDLTIVHGEVRHRR
ncbi:MAG: amidohydrolase [Longimicrobiales bacterium]|nr:amidohydrolase [Longimicrobiales bacterium]